MFKKLKDKIVEEAKNSPQRFQQITQSVSDKLQSTTTEESFFSIDDDTDSRPSASTTTATNEGGFISVSLHSSTPIEPRQRRVSNSSIASDVSFLPRYEPGNMYHLQSDIEASASEMEDNVSTASTQMGHITKEQVYAELQRVRMRYHKYRGRYTDLANHYKDLERENGKMKAVLVETQDISIRRIAELREQCQLEQKAKAHLENALRVEIDEKQYIIETLKTKIELLNTSNTSETLFETENAAGELTNGTSSLTPSPEYSQLTTDLSNAKAEIANLNDRIQELKASTIISKTKEANLLTRINELDAEVSRNANNNTKLAKLAELEAKVSKMNDLEEKLSKVNDFETKFGDLAHLERRLSKVEDLEAKLSALVEEQKKFDADRLKQKDVEEEYNLQMARDKMNLHTELQNKDLEIANLKSDLDTIREELEGYEKECGSKDRVNIPKMENLQSQNTKLIEKVESFSTKCKNMEAELLKMEHLRQENKHLSETSNTLKEVNKGFSKELSDLNLLKDNFKDASESLELAKNDIILLNDEKTNLQEQLEVVIKNNGSLNEKFSDLNMEHNDLDAKYNKLLIDNTSLSDSLISKNDELEKVRSDAKSSLLTLETKISKKLQQQFDNKKGKLAKQYEEKVQTLSVNNDNVKEVQLKLLASEDSIKSLRDDFENVKDNLHATKKKYDDLEKSHLELIDENQENLSIKAKLLSDLNTSEKKLENYAKTGDSKIKDLQIELESKLVELKHLNSLKSSSDVSVKSLEDKVNHLETSLQEKIESEAKFNLDLANLHSSLLDLNGTIKTLEKAIEEKSNEIGALNKRLQDKSVKCEKLEAVIAERTIEFDVLSTSADDRCKTFEDRLKKIQFELNNSLSNNDTLNNSLSETSTEIADLKIMLQQKEGVINGLIETIDQLSESVKLSDLEIQKVVNDKEGTSKQLEALLQEKESLLQQVKEKISLLDNINEQMQESQAQNKIQSTKIEELSSVQNDFEEQRIKFMGVASELNQLKLQYEELSKEKFAFVQQIDELKLTLSDSSKAASDLVQLGSEKEQLVKDIIDLNKTVENMTADNRRHKALIVDLQLSKDELVQVSEDKTKCLQEISELKGNLQRLVSDRQLLEQQVAQFPDVQRQFTALNAELTSEHEKVARLNDELSIITVRNRQLAEERDRLIEDSERLIVELETSKISAEEGLKNQEPTLELTGLNLLNSDLTSKLTSAQAEIASLTSKLDVQHQQHLDQNRQLSQSGNSENTLQQKITELSEMTRRFEAILEENKTAKEELVAVQLNKDALEAEKKRLELMVGDLDRHYSEIKHENQLLKDEIQELKISPINLTSSSKGASNSSLSNGTNNTESSPDLSREVEQLKEKVQQYKSIDATNRTSIEFYELELDRARARTEKLERKLDETLVTLRHCAELSGVDTQVEYLRHVLYNYMLGRESVVLARVIAAVCKFDPGQTEAVLKHEQQKQSLLGQLGIL